MDDEALIGYFIGNTDLDVYNAINHQFFDGEWPEQVDMKKSEILKARGDQDSEFMGEFYDRKYFWEKVGMVDEATEEDLKNLGILMQ